MKPYLQRVICSYSENTKYITGIKNRKENATTESIAYSYFGFCS